MSEEEIDLIKRISLVFQKHTHKNSVPVTDNKCYSKWGQEILFRNLNGGFGVWRSNRINKTIELKEAQESSTYLLEVLLFLHFRAPSLD